jgi:hypothetical protein
MFVEIHTVPTLWLLATTSYFALATDVARFLHPGFALWGLAGAVTGFKPRNRYLECGRSALHAVILWVREEDVIMTSQS